MPPNFEPHFDPKTSSSPPVTPAARPNTPPPIPNPLKQDHSIPVGEQHTVDLSNLPKNSGNNLFQSNESSANPNYDFILNSGTSKRNLPTKLPGSTAGRIGVITGGVIIFIIVIMIGSSLFSGSSNLPSMMSVLEDQQELIHISNTAAQEPDISSGNKNFAATASLSLNSGSGSLQSYLTKNGYSLSSSKLTLKESSATDQALTSAEAAGDFNTTFDQVTKLQLERYLQDIRVAYSQAKGPKGRAILSSDFNQAKLLENGLADGS